jgi:hypothetical protein
MPARDLSELSVECLPRLLLFPFQLDVGCSGLVFGCFPQRVEGCKLKVAGFRMVEC